MIDRDRENSRERAKQTRSVGETEIHIEKDSIKKAAFRVSQKSIYFVCLAI